MQLKNDKTAAVLKNSFGYMGSAGETFVERYMTEVLFDHSFHYDVDAATKEDLRQNRSNLGNAKSSKNEGLASEMMEQVAKSFREAADDEDSQDEGG